MSLPRIPIPGRRDQLRRPAPPGPLKCFRLEVSRATGELVVDVATEVPREFRLVVIDDPLKDRAASGRRLVWPWRPESNREAGSGIVANFLLHWFPNRISLRSLAFSASLYLGTITFVVFLV